MYLYIFPTHAHHSIFSTYIHVFEEAKGMQRTSTRMFVFMYFKVFSLCTFRDELLIDVHRAEIAIGISLIEIETDGNKNIFNKHRIVFVPLFSFKN